MRYPYDWIISMFKFNLIYPVSAPSFNKSKRKCHKCVLTISNLLFILFLGPQIYIVSLSPSYMMMFAFYLLVILAITYRCILCAKFHQIIEIASNLSTRRTIYRLRKYTWMHVFVILNFLTQIVLISHYVFTLIHDYNPYISFGYVSTPFYYNILSVAFVIHAVFIFTTPINIFSIFYVAVCQQLKLEISHFLKVMSSHTCPDYETLLRLYNNIASKVESIDDELSFMIMLSTVFYILNMYFFVFNLLDSEEYGSNQDFLNLCFFINICLVFISMSVSASLVSDASEKIVAKARELSSNNVQSGFVLQRFLFHANKGIGMTVWKMVPIRRHLIVVITGATFTYAVLFDSLKQK